MEKTQLLHVVRLLLSAGILIPLLGMAEPVHSEKPEKILVFVSFSMPETALQALYQEAEQEGAVLVLRGLKDHSFRQTAAILQRLGIRLQIDPFLFKEYAIEAVPTFIKIDEAGTHRITGNVSLAYALTRFKEST